MSGVGNLSDAGHPEDATARHPSTCRRETSDRLHVAATRPGRHFEAAIVVRQVLVTKPPPAEHLRRAVVSDRAIPSMEPQTGQLRWPGRQQCNASRRVGWPPPTRRALPGTRAGASNLTPPRLLRRCSRIPGATIGIGTGVGLKPIGALRVPDPVDCKASAFRHLIALAQATKIGSTADVLTPSFASANLKRRRTVDSFATRLREGGTRRQRPRLADGAPCRQHSTFGAAPTPVSNRYGDRQAVERARLSPRRIAINEFKSPASRRPAPGELAPNQHL